MLMATSTLGLEGAVAKELKSMGYRILRSESGRVFFEGDMRDIPKLNLWMRSAERILIPIGRFRATSFEELFECVANLKWEDVLTPNARFPVVKVRSVDSKLYGLRAIQRVVKKAVAKRLKSVYGTSEEREPVYPIRVYLRRNVAVVAVDTTGEKGLHKRGYRLMYSKAPLRETIAASILIQARYTGECPLVDPFCGSGTIPIEAAMIARSVAPGLKRNFVSEDWPHLEKIWKIEREIAMNSRKDQRMQILCSDVDGGILEVAHENAKRAGVDFEIEISDFRYVEIHWSFGKVVTNPPYGIRVDSRPNLDELARVFPGWEYHLIYPELDLRIRGMKARKRIPFFNSGIKVFLHQFF